MVDEVHADAVMDSRHERQAELRADAVSARHEHGIDDAGTVEGEQPAERPDVGQDAGRERPLREAADPPDDLVAGLDVYARLLVVHTDSLCPQNSRR
jgi:hypothetical protein